MLQENKVFLTHGNAGQLLVSRVDKMNLNHIRAT